MVFNIIVIISVYLLEFLLLIGRVVPVDLAIIVHQGHWTIPHSAIDVEAHGCRPSLIVELSVIPGSRPDGVLLVQIVVAVAQDARDITEAPDLGVDYNFLVVPHLLVKQ